MASLQQKIQQGLEKQPEQMSPTDLKVAHKNVLDSIKALKDASIAEPVDTQSKYDELAAQAEQLYKEKANRNEWLSLAQTIGNSLIKLGAARTGMEKGVDLSNAANPANLYDFGKSTDRAMDEYKTSLGELGRQRSQALDTAEAQRRQQMQGLGEESKFYGDQYSQLLRQKEQEASELAREKREEARQHIQEAKAAKSEEKSLKNQEIRRIDEMINDNQKKLQAAAQLSAQYKNYDDLSSKDQGRVDMAFSELAGKAGVDSDTLDTIREKSKEGTGLLGFMQSEDPEKKATLIDTEVAGPIREQLKRLEEQRARLSSPAAVQSTVAPTIAPAPKPAAGKLSQVQLREYATKNFKGNVEAARKFLTDKGYTVE